jgi:hypothetical protein
MDAYVLDASALIELHRHFGSGIRKLKKLALDGRLKLPEGIYRELQRRHDKLFKVVDGWSRQNTDVVVRIGTVHNLAFELARIEEQYGERITVGGVEYRGFWYSQAGQKAADGQLVAVAKVLGAIVVSEDKAVRLACMLEDVSCIGWAEFARKTNLSTQPTLPLG